MWWQVVVFLDQFLELFAEALDRVTNLFLLLLRQFHHLVVLRLLFGVFNTATRAQHLVTYVGEKEQVRLQAKWRHFE